MLVNSVLSFVFFQIQHYNFNGFMCAMMPQDVHYWNQYIRHSLVIMNILLEGWVAQIKLKEKELVIMSSNPDRRKTNANN